MCYWLWQLKTMTSLLPKTCSFLEPSFYCKLIMIKINLLLRPRFIGPEGGLWISIFSIQLLSVMCGHSVFSSPPQWPMTSIYEGFSIPDFIHYIFFANLILQKEPVFPFFMLSAKQGNYWYLFITSLVWRVPWLGIEPVTSRTWIQHSTTRLSMRRCLLIWTALYRFIDQVQPLILL